jgi:hypothetical protein
VRFHSFGWGFISGVSVGFEIPEVDNEELGFMLIVDLLIIRIIYQIFNTEE